MIFVKNGERDSEPQGRVYSKCRYGMPSCNDIPSLLELAQDV